VYSIYGIRIGLLLLLALLGGILILILATEAAVAAVILAVIFAAQVLHFVIFSVVVNAVSATPPAFHCAPFCGFFFFCFSTFSLIYGRAFLFIDDAAKLMMQIFVTSIVVLPPWPPINRTMALEKNIVNV